ncbi:hypothetical protein ES707_04482 [subsurface metagenome]
MPRISNHEAPISPVAIPRDAASRLLRMRAVHAANTRELGSRASRSLIKMGTRFPPSEFPPHVHAPPLYPRARTARQGSTARLDPGLRQPPSRGRPVRRAGAVRQDHRRDVGQAGDDGVVRHRLAMAAVGGLGGVRPVHHRLQRGGGAERRQAGASPAPGGADRLFRTHHAAAADLPHRHPFRHADEDDAERHRRAVAAMARLLPRAFCRDPVGGGATAAVALHQLATGDPAVRALRHLHGSHHAGGAQDLWHADGGRGAIQRPLRARVRRAWQCGSGAELRTHRFRGAGPALRRRQIARSADARAVVVGAGHRHHPRLHHHHGACDLHRRHRAAQQGSHHRRRDRDVRLLCHHADPEARTGGELHQQCVHGSAAPEAILRRAGRGARRARPAGRGRYRTPLRSRRVQRRLLLL